jgi:hypothetical protein
LVHCIGTSPQRQYRYQRSIHFDSV